MSEKQPSFKESLNNSLEIIAEEPVLRGLLNAIPSVGGSLNELMAGKGQQMIEERRDNLLRLLAEHMEAIEAEAIRKDYFETPKGFDLLIQALDSSRRTRSEEKRDLIARVLAGAAADDNGEYSPEEYLSLISDLTVKELKVARSLYERRPEHGDIYYNWHREILQELNIDDADLRVILDRLQARGLCQNLLTPTPDTSRVYRSPGFVKLMDFLGFAS
jgi:hypothetical protein